MCTDSDHLRSHGDVGGYSDILHSTCQAAGNSRGSRLQTTFLFSLTHPFPHLCSFFISAVAELLQPYVLIIDRPHAVYRLCQESCLSRWLVSDVKGRNIIWGPGGEVEKLHSFILSSERCAVLIHICWKSEHRLYWKGTHMQKESKDGLAWWPTPRPRC